MSKSSDVANALLAAKLPNPQVANLVFRNATHLEKRKMSTPLDDALALASAKRDGWQAATLHARSTTSSTLLAKLAKDSRKQVRREVATNPATPRGSQEYLFEWAVKNDDTETFEALAEHIDLEWILEPEQLVGIPRNAQNAWRHLGRRIAATDNPAVVAALQTSNHVQLLTHVVSRVRATPESIISLTELIDSYDEQVSQIDWRQSVADSMAYGNEVFDVELARIVAGFARDHILESLSARSVTPEAFEVLMASPRPVAWRGAANLPLEPGQIDAVIAKRDSRATLNLLGGNCENCEPRQIDTILLELDSMGVRYTGKRYKQMITAQAAKLRAVDPDAKLISSDAMIALLSQCDLDSIASWLSGSAIIKPAPGDPAKMFAKARVRDMYGYRPGPQNNLSDGAVAARDLSGYVREFLGHEWTDETIDAFGMGVFFLFHDDAFAEYFTERMTAGIGVSTTAWETMFGLLESFNGNLSSLIDVTRRLVHASGEQIVLA
jgi:hypothetical protein